MEAPAEILFPRLFSKHSVKYFMVLAKLLSTTVMFVCKSTDIYLYAYIRSDMTHFLCISGTLIFVSGYLQTRMKFAENINYHKLYPWGYKFSQFSSDVSGLFANVVKITC